jgi:hypothetical protein
MEEKIQAIPTKSTAEAPLGSAGGFVLEDEILIMKDEIANEAEKIASQEIGKQQTSATACGMIKKELANKAAQSHGKLQNTGKSMP